MIDLRAIQFCDDVESAISNAKGDADVVRWFKGQFEENVRKVSDALNNCEQKEPPAVRDQLVGIKENLLQLVNVADDLRRTLKTTGFLRVAGFFGADLVALMDQIPTLRSRKGIDYLQNLGLRGEIFRELYRRVLVEPSAGQFAPFTESSANLYLEDAFERTRQLINELEKHNTNWWTVAFGVGTIVVGTGHLIVTVIPPGIHSPFTLVEGILHLVGGSYEIYKGLNE